MPTAQAFQRADQCSFRKMTFLILLFSGGWTEWGRPVGLKSTTDPSSHHFDTHNNTVLQAGATCLGNCCQTPQCIIIIALVLLNNSTAIIHSCTTPCSLNSTEHHTDRAPSGGKQSYWITWFFESTVKPSLMTCCNVNYLSATSMQECRDGDGGHP
jgi:hypothetical protein